MARLNRICLVKQMRRVFARRMKISLRRAICAHGGHGNTLPVIEPTDALSSTPG